MKKKKRTIFITGSVRSGKSDFALTLADSLGKDVVFIATCGIEDDIEMEQRIEQHQKNRPKHWKTIEQKQDIVRVLQSVSSNADVIIVDCLTLWVSNLLAADYDEKTILSMAQDAAKISKQIKPSLIYVSNEVGSGIVPDNKLARTFRDIMGKVNQIFCRFSDEAYLLVAGTPIKLK